MRKKRLVIAILVCLNVAAVAFAIGRLSNYPGVNGTALSDILPTEIGRGEVEKLDVNADGSLDLRLKLYDNDVREGYYYFISNGNFNGVEFLPITDANGILVLPERLIFRGNDVIAIGREERHYYIKTLRYAVPDPFLSAYKVNELFFSQHRINSTDEDNLSRYFAWIDKLTNTPQTSNSTRLEVSTAEAKTMVLAGEVRFMAVMHGKPLEFETLSGQEYQTPAAGEGEIMQAVNTCGTTCEFISILMS